jgi:hypothetical protein
MKFVKIFFLWFSLLVFLILAGGVGIGIYYGNDVKALVVEEISNSLATKVDVKGVDFSVFKKFPFASVDFSDVVIFESVNGSAGNDTLLRAGNIYLCFNLFDIFNKRYILKKIQLTDAYFKPHIDNRNRKNFIIWKEDPEKEENAFQLALDEIIFKNFAMLYENDFAADKIAFKASDLSLSGKFSSEKYNLKGKGDLFCESLQFDKISYIKKQPIKIDFNLLVDNEKYSYSFERSNLTIADISLAVGGIIENAPSKNVFVDLALNGGNIKINQLLSLLPSQFSNQISSYESDGLFKFSGEIKGEVSDKLKPAITADFGIEKGTLFHSGSSTRVNNIFLSGKFSTGKSSSASSAILEISEFSCNPGVGTVSGKFTLKDFTQPKLTAALKSEFDLKEFSELIKADTLEYVTGRASADLNIELTLHPDSNWSAKDFRNTRSSGNIFVSDAAFKFRESNHQYSDFAADLSFNNNDIIVRKLSGNLNNSDFALSGVLKNIFPWFFDENEKMLVDAKFRSENLMLDELLTSSQSTSTDTVYNLQFSNRINVAFDAKVGKLNFRRFEAEKISGRVDIKNNIFSAEDLYFNALGGEISASGKIEGASNNSFKISCKSAIAGIDVKKLFYQFENFGQNTLTDNHLKGTASAGVEFSATMDHQLNIDEKSIYCKASVMIEKANSIILSQ